MGFIELAVAADRLGITLSYLRDLIDRVDRIPTVLDPTPGADFWSSSTGVINERDLRIYENLLRRRRFLRFRERYADVLISDAMLMVAPGWQALLERAGDRVRWMPADWGVRIMMARERFGYLSIRFACVPTDENFYPSGAFKNEVERLYEELRLSSLSICEECGRQGRWRYSPSRSLTLCDRHARLAEPTLAGDGVIADPASDGATLSELPLD